MQKITQMYNDLSDLAIKVCHFLSKLLFQSMRGGSKYFEFRFILNILSLSSMCEDSATVFCTNAFKLNPKNILVWCKMSINIVTNMKF